MNVALYRPKVPTPNQYVNPGFTGGGPNTPPTSHSIGGGTGNSQPLDNGDGTFTWQCNPEEVSCRNYLFFQLPTNYPGLQVGDKINIYYDIENKSASVSQACFLFVGISNVTTTVINNTVPAGQKGTVSAILEITGLPYACEVRVGTGVPSNSVMWIEINNPKIYIK